MNDSQNLGDTFKIIEQAAYQKRHQATIYTIQPGDTLSKIITDHYRIRVNDPQYKIAETSALLFNHHIDNPDHIRAGDVIRLMAIPGVDAIGYCEIPTGFEISRYYNGIEPLFSDKSAWIRDRTPPDNGPEQDAFTLLSYLEENRKALALTAAGAGANVLGSLVGRGSSDIIRDVQEIYDDYKDEKITKNQYDYQRRKLLQSYKDNMGPFDEIFLGGNPNEQLRINRRKGIPATHRIERYAHRMEKLSRYASRGGYLLTATGAYLGCRDIAATDNQQEKNEIFVETAVGTVTGIGSSMALGFFLATNPVGWALGITLAVGAAVGTYAAAEGAGKLYDSQLNEYDLVNMSGFDRFADKWC